MATDERNSQLADHQLAHKRLVFEVAITANATPASKTHTIKDIPGVVLLRTEGKTSDADAVEDLSAEFATADDNDGAATPGCQFGMLLKGSELGDLKKVLKVSVTEKTSLSTGLTVTSAASDYLTDGGNIAIDIAGAGLTLDTESPTFLVEVDYVREL